MIPNIKICKNCKWIRKTTSFKQPLIFHCTLSKEIPNFEIAMEHWDVTNIYSLNKDSIMLCKFGG